MQGVTLWVALGLAAAAIVGFVVWQSRRRPGPNSLEALGLVPEPVRNDPGEVARLRQSLRVKVLHDEAQVERLVAAERERMPSAAEVEWYRAAVARWEQDNR